MSEWPEIVANEGVSDALFRADFARHARGDFTLRTETAADRLFLRHLFDATTAEATARTGAASLADDFLLSMQFESQTASYRATFPNASYYVVEHAVDQRPVGRFVIDWTADTQAIGVDIAVLPSERGGAVGLHLLRAWLSTCDRLGREARLHVTPENPARRIYQRLGFVELDAGAFPVPMVRHARSRPLS